MDIYAQNILDRYKEPHYKDSEIDANSDYQEVNHSCGDKITVKLKVHPPTKGSGPNGNSKLEKFSFSGVGCAISMAAADILGDLIVGMEIDDVLEMTKEDLFEALGIEISLRRSKCALLGLVAVKNAILKYKGEKADACCKLQ